MPSLTFVLPHWLYWSVLAALPAVAFAMVYREQLRRPDVRPSYFLAYLFLVTAGFLGIHRFYLRSAWGLLFLPFFLAVLWTAGEVRDAREDVSRTRAASEQAERVLTRAKTAAARATAGPVEQAAVADADAKAAAPRVELAAARNELSQAETNARIAAIVLGLMVLGDAVYLPVAIRRTRAREIPEPPLPKHPMETAVSDTPLRRPGPGFGWLEPVVKSAGEFAAYWALIAVFTYYYEVIARYVFNSPTNWVHESMFLMFGMQYMLAGAYAYRDDTHVRVDVIYTHLSRRGKAICDIITSFFFFLFTGTMLVTGWKFASDAISVGEHSFSEWAIEYWPVKLAMPIGAGLIVLQGLSRLSRDIATVVGRDA